MFIRRNWRLWALLAVVLAGGTGWLWSQQGEEQQTQMILERVQKANKLVTAEFYLQIVVEQHQALQWGSFVFPGSEKRLFILVPGRVQAGFDLSRLKAEDLTVDWGGSRIRLKLPPTEILAVEPDLAQMRMFKDDGLFNGVTLQDTERATKEVAGRMRQETQSLRLLERADAMGRQALTEFLLGMGFSQVELL